MNETNQIIVSPIWTSPKLDDLQVDQLLKAKSQKSEYDGVLSPYNILLVTSYINDTGDDSN